MTAPKELPPCVVIGKTPFITQIRDPGCGKCVDAGPLSGTGVDARCADEKALADQTHCPQGITSGSSE